MRILRRRLTDERGQAVLSQLLLVVPVLLLIIGVVYDLGALAVAQARLQDAADLAVQDAAKHLDYAAFWETQTLRLTPAAAAVAHQRLQQYAGDQPVTLTRLAVVRPDPGHEALVLEAQTEVPLRILRWVGLTAATRIADAVTVPAFGVSREGQ